MPAMWAVLSAPGPFWLLYRVNTDLFRLNDAAYADGLGIVGGLLASA
ncbi:MAG: hypothetical protein ACLFTK_04425 [Anaerolineales bacterium]